jgi:hypothetical protein
VSWSAAPSVPKQPRTLLRSRRASLDISPVLPPAPDEMFPAGAQALSNLRRRECSHLCLRHRRLAPPRWTTPAQQNSHDPSSISVSVKPESRKPPFVTETARELKSSAWPDVGEASEGHLPRQVAPVVSAESAAEPDHPLEPLCLPRIVGRRSRDSCPQHGWWSCCARTPTQQAG